jgi:protein FLOWERING LOCUS T
MSDPLVLAHVIRDVLDPFRQSVPIRVIYTNRLMLNGAELRTSAVVNRPKIEIGGNDLRVFFTLVSYLIYIMCVMCI